MLSKFNLFPAGSAQMSHSQHRQGRGIHVHDEHVFAHAAMSFFFSPFHACTANTDSNISNMGKDEQTRLHDNRLWRDSILHPASHSAAETRWSCSAVPRAQAPAWRCFTPSHVLEEERYERRASRRPDGHLSAAIHQEISALDCAFKKKKGGERWGGTHLLQDFQTHDSQMLCEKNKLAALPFLLNRDETDWYPTFMAAPLPVLEKQQRRVCFSELFPSDISLE